MKMCYHYRVDKSGKYVNKIKYIKPGFYMCSQCANMFTPADYQYVNRFVHLKNIERLDKKNTEDQIDSVVTNLPEPVAYMVKDDNECEK